MPFGLLFWTAAGLEWIYRKFKLPGEPFLTRYAVCTLGFAQTLNINRARDVLGYKPEKRLKDAVREYGTWWRNGKKNEQEYRGSVKVRGGMGQKNEACE